MKPRPTGPSPSRAVDEHFESTEPEQILAQSRQLMLIDPSLPRIDEETSAQGPALLHPTARRTSLQAYLASALTGLSEAQRRLVFEASDVVNEVCLELDISLYEPRKSGTDPVHDPDVPDAEVFKKDHDRVVTSDLVIHLCHFPSTGSGEELAFAYNSLVPIVLVARDEQRISRMISGIPSLKLEVRYKESDDLRILLPNRLFEIRPYLEERRLLREQASGNIVGQRVRELRLDLGLTREQLGERVGLTADGVKHLEESVGAEANPSLTHLQHLAMALKTTVAELIIPDFNGYVMSHIQAALYQKVPARFYDYLTKRDQFTLMRRYLYRVLDSLERLDKLSS